MTTFYLDFEGGNDAADGLSFATRWKTIRYGATTARTAPGDVIRVMASPDPVNLGNATWTDNSNTIVWSTPKNKVIDECESGWLGVTFSTVTHSTVQARTGTACAQSVINSSFTTGKVMYKALPATLDLSAYRQLSFWFQCSATCSFYVALCSDSAGNTPIAILPTVTKTSGTSLQAGSWVPVSVDYGAPLPSGVNSVALYAATDLSSNTWRIDNIVACTATGPSDAVVLGAIYGKNTTGEPEWYSIDQITDTGAILGSYGGVGRPYRGATETVATYKRLCVEPLFAETTLQEDGADGARIMYSGGWNRTDMSTQTGETWLAGMNGCEVGFLSRAYVTSERFGFFFFMDVGLDVREFNYHNVVGTVACRYSFRTYTAAGLLGVCDITIDHSWGGGSNFFDGNSNLPVRLKMRLLHGGSATSSTSSLFVPMVNNGLECTYDITRIENNMGYGMRAPGHSNFKMRGVTFRYNDAADIEFPVGTQGQVSFEDSQFLSPVKVSGSWAYELAETRIAGNPLANRITRKASYFATQTSVVRSEAVAWELGFSSEIHNQYFPARFPLVKAACLAGTAVTVKVWLRRNGSSTLAGLYIPDQHAQGIAETTVWMTAAVDTWEEVTITFTPTTSGVFEVMATAYGPSTGKAYFSGAITVTQA